MNAPELIEAVRAAGGEFVVDGDRLGIFPKAAAQPVLENLRARKGEIIALLSSRTTEESSIGSPAPPLPPGVRLVRWAPKNPPIPISKCETVLDVQLFIGSSLLQLEAMLQGKRWQGGNWGLAGLLERLAAVGCHVALADPKAALQ